MRSHSNSPANHDYQHFTVRCPQLQLVLSLKFMLKQWLDQRRGETLFLDYNQHRPHRWYELRTNVWSKFWWTFFERCSWSRRFFFMRNFWSILGIYLSYNIILIIEIHDILLHNFVYDLETFLMIIFAKNCWNYVKYDENYDAFLRHYN